MDDALEQVLPVKIEPWLLTVGKVLLVVTCEAIPKPHNALSHASLMQACSFVGMVVWEVFVD